MIYLYIALYQEAKPLIRELCLKRRQAELGVDVYENETIRLILTGAGPLAAASVVAGSLAYYRAGGEDLLLNWGSCASSTEETGNVYLCHKLVDRASRRTFYPDMLVRAAVPEACVITEAREWECASEHTPDEGPLEEVYRRGLAEAREEGQEALASALGREIYLHDMEAAAVYFAGSYVFSPDQMHFMKVVTDRGRGDFSESRLTDVMDEGTPQVLEYLEQLRMIQERSPDRGEPVCEEIERIYKEFHCSQTMKAAVLQCIRYWTLVHTDYRAQLQSMRESGDLPCRDKREGKKRFEQLRAKLL